MKVKPKASIRCEGGSESGRSMARCGCCPRFKKKRPSVDNSLSSDDEEVEQELKISASSVPDFERKISLKRNLKVIIINMNTQ